MLEVELVITPGCNSKILKLKLEMCWMKNVWFKFEDLEWGSSHLGEECVWKLMPGFERFLSL